MTDQAAHLITNAATFGAIFAVVFLGIFVPYAIRRAWSNRPSARHRKEES